MAFLTIEVGGKLLLVAHVADDLVRDAGRHLLHQLLDLGLQVRILLLDVSVKF